MRTFESKAVQSLKRSQSLRTTVPEAVAALLGLEAGDVIVWAVEPGSGHVAVSRREGAVAEKLSSKRR